jgi:hypothetical protein
MCGDLVRDGTTTKRIPDRPANCENYNCNTDVEYGMHEPFEWYEKCKATQRNKGLFTANQRLRGSDARYTRQNPNGARRGYECPEERDYYPYWRPTPWMDLAVLTDDPTRCAAYQAESQNVKPRSECLVEKPHYNYLRQKYKKAFLPTNEAACESLTWFSVAMNKTFQGQWNETAAFGIAAPRCQANFWSRDNHHGNTPGENEGFMQNLNLTLSDAVISEHCVFRLRYNITTTDYQAWESPESVQSGPVTAANSTSPRKPNQQPANVDIASRLGIPDASERTERGYVFKNNPQVDLFGKTFKDNLNNDFRVKLQLAINTAQLGRTFQDRTHTFGVRRPPSEIAGARIHNLQVRGKRGNIVQTYPAVEYDFSPNRLEVGVGEFIHIQWTGSNTNPNNNDGQGKRGTDRSNMVILRDTNYNEAGVQTSDVGHWGNSYPVKDVLDTPFLGLDKESIIALAINQPPQYGGEQSELDDSGTFFDLGLKQVTREGIYRYMCTRNNNFSNRSQKGMIKVGKADVRSEIMGTNGGSVSTPQGNELTVQKGDLKDLAFITMSSISPDAPEVAGANVEDIASDFVVVQPAVWGLADGRAAVMRIQYEGIALGTAKLYRSDTAGGNYVEIDGSFDGSTATFAATEGGVYVVTSELNVGVVVGIVFACLGFVGLVAVAVWYKKRRRAPDSDGMPLSNL